MSIGTNIRKIRKSKKMSQSELGKLLGVSQAMVAQYENGTRIPKKETIRRIAYALEVYIGRIDEDWGIDISNNPAEYEKFKRKLDEFESDLEEKILLENYWNLDANKRKNIFEQIEQINNPNILTINTATDTSHPFYILQEKIKRGEELTEEEKAQFNAYMKDAISSLSNALKKFGETLKECYQLLNDEGQKKANEQIEHAVKQVEMLTKIPEYQRKEESED